MSNVLVTADPVRTLLAAQKAFEEVSAELSRQGDRIGGAAGDALKYSPASLVFTRATANSRRNAALSRHYINIDPDDWPLAEIVQPLLARWHEARSAVHEAWRSIPPQERARLKPPIC